MLTLLTGCVLVAALSSPVTSPGDMIVPADRVVNAVNVREAPTTASALMIKCASEVVDSHTIAQIERR
jgi:hypothetical protein